MAVAVSATGTATHNAGLVTETFTFTVNAADTLAVFFIGQDSATANSISSVIWDFGGTNQTCTLVKAQTCTPTSNGSMNAYAVVNPTSGTKTLQVVQGLGQGMTAELQSYTGSVTTSVAAACTLAVSAVNSNQNSSLPTITGATGDMDVGAFVSSGTINSINQTQIWLSAAGEQTAGANATSAGAAITFTLAQSATVSNAGVGFNIVAAAGGGSGTATAGAGIDNPPITFTRKTIFQTLSFVPVVTTPTLTWNAWTDWPDFAPKNRNPVDFVPYWHFLQPPPQVFYPFDRWTEAANKTKPSADFPFETLVVPLQPTAWTQWTRWPDSAPKAPPLADLRPWTFVPPPAQVFYPFDRWQDIAWAAKRVAQNPDWAYGTFVTPSFIPTWTAWTQWPDFATKAKPAADFVPWSFVPPPFQVWYPHDSWPDKLYSKPIAADFPFQALTLQTPPQVWYPPGNWDDFTRSKFVQVDTRPWIGPGVTVIPPTVWNAWTDWPDFASKAKPAADFIPWSFVAPSLPFPYTQWQQWPDFATKAKPVTDFMPWRFIPPTKQVWFPPDPWPDYIWKKPVPLNYEPFTWTGTATVKTPWVTMTTWPDFAPIRGKPGLPPQLQQFLAKYAGLIALPTITATMQAIGTTSDGAIFAINVIPSPGGGTAAATALVSIQEIGHI